MLLLMRPRPSTCCPAPCGAWSNPVVRPTPNGPTSWRSGPRAVPDRCGNAAPGGPQQPSAHHDICETRGCQSSSGMKCCEIARIRARFRYLLESGVLRTMINPPASDRPRGDVPVLRPVGHGSHALVVTAAGPARLDSTPCLLFPLKRSHGLRRWLGWL